jgi:hypothetical protein
MFMPINFILPGIIFLLTLAFGLCLSRSGKPYNGILFNIHKLIALGTVVLTVLRVIDTLKGAQTGSFVIALLCMAGICILALFISGALMSEGKRAIIFLC